MGKGRNGRGGKAARGTGRERGGGDGGARRADTKDHKAKRAYWAEVGKETLAIAKCGRYRSLDGQKVEMKREADAARANTVFYTPDDHPEKDVVPFLPHGSSSSSSATATCSSSTCSSSTSSPSTSSSSTSSSSTSSSTSYRPLGRRDRNLSAPLRVHVINGSCVGVTLRLALQYDDPMLGATDGEANTRSSQCTASDSSASELEPLAADITDTADITDESAGLPDGMQVLPRVCVLNFASAKNPGGGVRTGAQAQEEALCRSSALLRCIEPGPGYAINKNARGFGGFYTNHVTYTPAVPFFRNDAGDLLPPQQARCVGVVTSAAPNRKPMTRKDHAKADEVLRTRIDRALALMYLHGHDVLVLGAFGCGVFGNEPSVVADAFASLLCGKYRGCFTHVVFAVMSKRGENIDEFRAAFGDQEGFEETWEEMEGE